MGRATTGELAVELVGDGLPVPCVDGIERPVPEPRRGRVDERPARGRRAGRRVPAVVLERPPRRRLQVAAGHRRLRGGPRRRSALRRARRAATTWPSSAATPPRPSTTSPTACGSTRRRGRHDRRRAPRQPAAVGAGRDPPRSSSAGPTARSTLDDVARRSTPRPRRGCWPSPAPPTSPAGCRRSTRSSTPPTPAASRCWSTPPSSPPHRPLPADADFVAWSGHKMYAPFGAGALIGPRAAFAEGDPFLAGGGAVDLVDLDEVVWTDPPEREEAGSPNVIGAVALGAADRRAQQHRLGRDRRPRRRAGPPAARRPGRDPGRAPARPATSTPRPCRSRPSSSRASPTRSSRPG